MLYPFSKSHLRIATLAMLLSSTSPVLAQTNASPNPPATSATTSSAAPDPQAEAPVTGSEGGEIIVTAQKRSERLSEVPATLLLVTQEQLAKSGVRVPSDLTIAVPGLNYAVSNGFAQPAMRGITTFSSAANVEIPVGIYIDGILQPSQTANSAFDLRLVSEMDVLKGPQGTVFGRNVVGGAILFKTRDPNLTTTEGEVSGDISAFGGGSSNSAFAYSALGFISVPIKRDEIAASFAFSRRYNEGFVKDLTPGFDGRTGGSHTENFQAKLLFEPSSNVRAVLNFRYMNARNDQGPTIADGVSTVLRFSDGLIASQPWQTTHNQAAVFAKTRTHSVSLKGDWDTDAGTISSLTAWQSFASPTQSNSNGGYSPMCVAAGTCFSLFLTPNIPKMVSQELNFSSRKFGPASIVTGVYALDKKIRSGRRQNGILALDLSSVTKSYAGFAEVTLDVTDRLKAIAGGRYNYDSEAAAGTNFATLPFGPVEKRHWSAFTKRFSVKYRASDQLNLYGTYSEGYQPGIIATQNFNTAAGAIIASAKPIEPQRLDAWEIGGKFNAPGVSLNVAAFTYNYKNILSQSFNGSVITLQNAAAARLRGIDTDFRIDLARGLKLSGGMSWLPRANYTSFPNATVVVKNGVTAQSVTRDLKGFRLIRAPKITASGSLNYGFETPGGDWDLNTTAYYSSGFSPWTGFANVQPSYATLALSASFRPSSGPLEISVFGRNLTNNAYLASAVRSNASYQDYYSPPREIGVGAKYRF